MAGVFALAPGDAFNFYHPMVVYGVLELWQKGLEGFKGQINRLVQRFVQLCPRQGAGFLVPLRHIELFVQCYQGRGHGVDDAVKVVLKTGEFFLDFAAYLYFQLQFAIGIAGFFSQCLSLVVRSLGFIPGTL